MAFLMDNQEPEKKIYTFEADTAKMEQVAEYCSSAKESLSKVIRDSIDWRFGFRQVDRGARISWTPDYEHNLRKAGYAIAGATPQWCGSFVKVCPKTGWVFVYWANPSHQMCGCRLVPYSRGILRAVSGMWWETVSPPFKKVGLTPAAEVVQIDRQEISFHESEAHDIAPAIVELFSAVKTEPYRHPLVKTHGDRGYLWTRLGDKMQDENEIENAARFSPKSK